MNGANEKYLNFSIEDFVWDELFRSWVNDPTPETEIFWKEWLIQNPQKTSYIETARQIVLALRISHSSIDAAEIEKQIEQITVRRSMDENSSQPTKSVRLWNSGLFRAAAVFILLAGLGLTFYLLRQKANGLSTIATVSGAQKKIILSDSSSIVLNSNSSITFKEQWSANETREIWMEGEGYFHIRHLDKDNKITDHERFLVHVKELTVEVLGTTFDIRNRRNKTEIVLKEGMVRLHFNNNKHEDIIMSPEDIVTIEANDSISVAKTRADDYSAWIHQKLILKNSHLREILSYLEDNYSKKIILSDTSLLNRRIDGTLLLDNFDDALFILSKILKVKIQQNDSTIYFIKM